MKRILLFFFFFFFLAAVVLAGCKSKEKVSNPEDIGPQVMNILIQLNDLNGAEFAENFISFNELEALMEDDVKNLGEEQRHSLLFPTSKSSKTQYDWTHRRLKASGLKYRINWEKIQFVSFTHEMLDRGSLKVCQGVLMFKYQGTKYALLTGSLYDGSDYILASLGNISAVSDDPL